MVHFSGWWNVQLVVGWDAPPGGWTERGWLVVIVLA